MFRAMLIGGVILLVAVFGYVSQRTARTEKSEGRFKPWRPAS